MQGKVFTISNMLSFSRILLMIPVAYCLQAQFSFHREIAVIIVLLAMVTDALDGYLARKLNEISDLGKIIDPLADKIGVGIVVIMLMIFGDIPLWFMSLVIIRDVLIFLGGSYVQMKKGVLLVSTMSGKVTVVLISLTLIFAMLKTPSFNSLYLFFLWSSVAGMVYSFSIYLKRFYSIIVSRSH